MRKAPLILVSALAAAAATLALLPWWLGPVLRPVARLCHAQFGGYERVGYARFRITDVRREHRGVRVEADKIEADTPVVWLWRRLGGEPPVVTIGEWRATAIKDPASPPDPAAGMAKLQNTLSRQVAPRLVRWLPRATMDRGVVRWSGGELTLQSATWERGELTVRGFRWKGLHDVTVVARLGDGGVVHADLELPEPAARAMLTWTGAEITGTGMFWEQPFRVAFHYAATGWVPGTGTIDAADWRLPAGRLKLAPAYATVHGGGHFAWKERAFDLTLHATAEAKAGETAPPLTAGADIKGDRDGWSVSTFQVRAPFGRADLSAPVRLGYDGRLRSGPARLTFDGDLARQPWTEARGRLTGVLAVEPAGGGGAVQGTFKFAADDIAVHSVALKHAAGEGEVHGPRVEFTRATIEIDDETHAEIHGAYDAQTRMLDGVVATAQVGRRWLARRLPAGWAWDRVEATAHVSGPLMQPVHAGNLRVAQVRLPRLKPLDGRITWKGEGATVSDFHAEVTAGASMAELGGAASREAVRLTRLRLVTGGTETWHNEGVATIAWAPHWRLDALQLKGPDSTLSADVSGDGSVRLAVEHLRSEWLHDWTELRGPAWRVTMANLVAELGGAKPQFTATASGEIELAPRVAHVFVSIEGDRSGVKLGSLNVVEGAKTLTEASGRLPLVWDAKASPQWRLDVNAPFELEAKTEPDSPLWAALAAPAGIGLAGAEATAQFHGTLREPAGELRARVARINGESDRLKTVLPKIEDLALTLQVDQRGISLDALSARVEGQAVSAAAHLPMDGEAWTQLWSGEHRLDWRDLAGRIEIPDAEMTPLSRRLPDLVATQGHLSAQLELAAGGRMSGRLSVANAATRPIAPLGVVQDVNLELALQDRTIAVRTFGARIGGQPVTLSGTATLPERGAPRLAMALQARNVPLVRRPGLLVRTDLDLRADTNAAGTTRLSGIVTLRDCLVLADLAALLPTGERGVSRVPPYFAVDQAPFRSWQLGVELRGDRAVRIRTAVFKGTASPRFQLGGTLAEPRAVGELAVDQGQVLFPFATFEVQLGSVRLQEADPFHPELNLTATSRRYGYDVRMEATGAPDSPNVTFSSNPSLDSAQLLLMVMTGQKPASDTLTSNGEQRLTRVGAFFGQELIQGLGVGSDEERLEISSGEQISLQGRETYQIEYKLNDRWSVIGEYDEFDDYNAGVKWRVYTQGGAREKN